MNNTTTTEATLHTWTITTHMPGYLPEGDGVEPFDATADDAITALLDEAEFQVGEIDYEDEIVTSDLALIDSYRVGDGRGDLLFLLDRDGEVSIRLESYANGFGGYVSLTRDDV